MQDCNPRYSENLVPPNANPQYWLQTHREETWQGWNLVHGLRIVCHRSLVVLINEMRSALYTNKLQTKEIRWIYCWNLIWYFAHSCSQRDKNRRVFKVTFVLGRENFSSKCFKRDLGETVLNTFNFLFKILVLITGNVFCQHFLRLLAISGDQWAPRDHTAFLTQFLALNSPPPFGARDVSVMAIAFSLGIISASASCKNTSVEELIKWKRGGMPHVREEKEGRVECKSRLKGSQSSTKNQG